MDTDKEAFDEIADELIRVELNDVLDKQLNRLTLWLSKEARCEQHRDQVLGVNDFVNYLIGENPPRRSTTALYGAALWRILELQGRL